MFDLTHGEINISTSVFFQAVSVIMSVNADTNLLPTLWQMTPDNEYYLSLWLSDISNRQVIRAAGINERISDIYW